MLSCKNEFNQFLFTFVFNFVKMKLTYFKVMIMENWVENLSEEDQIFVKRLVLNSGSLKKLSKEYNVSYPTIRLRIDRLIQKIEFSENNTDIFKSKLMQLVIDNELNLEAANKILEFHQEERK